MVGVIDQCGDKDVLGITTLGSGTINIVAWGTTSGYYSTYSPANSGSWWSDVLPPNFDHTCVYVSVNTYQGTKFGNRCFP